MDKLHKPKAKLKRQNSIEVTKRENFIFTLLFYLPYKYTDCSSLFILSHLRFRLQEYIKEYLCFTVILQGRSTSQNFTELVMKVDK